MLNVNRAIDGDLVALELVDPSSVSGSSAMDLGGEEEAAVQKSAEETGASVPNENAEATYDVIEGIASEEKTTGSVALQGRVVGIIRRNWRQYAGSLDMRDAQVTRGGDVEGAVATSVQFVPVDKRIPRIWISTRRVEELADCRMLVTIDQWPATSLYPYGHYVSVLGKNGDKGVETQVLLHEFDVPHEAFSSAVMACLPHKDWSITEDVVRERTDLRHIPVVSIDPPGCKDIDDALHCIRLPNGRLQAGVHIAGMIRSVSSPAFV
jgi:exosome complex exonuclease DIS3/RRP44